MPTINANLDRQKNQVTFPLGTVVQFVIYGIIITGTFFGIKLSLADRVGTVEGNIKVLDNKYDNLAASIAEIKNNQSEQNSFLRTLLIDRGYDPDKVVTRTQ